MTEVKALRQRVKELLQMITDQDYEYNRKTNALIKRHADQLATQAEQIKVARDAIDAHLNPCGCFNGCEFCNGKTTLEEALAKLGGQ